MKEEGLTVLLLTFELIPVTGLLITDGTGK